MCAAGGHSSPGMPASLSELQQDPPYHPAATLLVSLFWLCFCPARAQNQALLLLCVIPIVKVLEIQPSCCGQRACSVACV